MDCPADDRGNCSDECYGNTHSYSALAVLRDSDERTESKELYKYEVLNEDICDYDSKIAHAFFPLEVFHWKNALR